MTGRGKHVVVVGIFQGGGSGGSSLCVGDVGDYSNGKSIWKFLVNGIVAVISYTVMRSLV